MRSRIILILLIAVGHDNPKAIVQQQCQANDICECIDTKNPPANIDNNCKDLNNQLKLHRVSCPSECTGNFGNTCDLQNCCLPKGKTNAVNYESLAGYSGGTGGQSFTLDQFFDFYPGQTGSEDCGIQCILTNWGGTTCDTISVTGTPSSLTKLGGDPYYSWDIPYNQDSNLQLCIQCKAVFTSGTAVAYSENLRFSMIHCFQDFAAGTTAANTIPDTILYLTRTNVESATIFQTVSSVSNYASWTSHATKSVECGNPTYELFDSDCSTALTALDSTKYYLDASNLIQIQNLQMATKTFCLKSTNPHQSLQFVQQTFDVTVECGTAKELLQQDASMTTTQTVQISNDPIQFTFVASDFDNISPITCPEVYYIDGPALTLANSYTVSPTLPLTDVGIYEFFIKAYIASQGPGPEDFVSGKMTLIVECDSNVVITLPTIAFQQDQYINNDLMIAPNSYVFEESSIQYTGCGPLIYELSSTTTTFSALTDTPSLTVTNTVQGFVTPNAQLIDPQVGKMYQFYIRARSTLGGAEIYYPNQYTLYYGCDAAWTSITVPTSLQSPVFLVKSLGATAAGANEFTIDDFVPSLSYCPIIDYSIIPSSATDPSNTQISKLSPNCDGLTMCTEKTFTVDLSLKQDTGFNNGPLNFQVQATILGGKTVLSQPIEIKVICGPLSNKVTESTTAPVIDHTVTQDYMQGPNSRWFPFDLDSYLLDNTECPVTNVEISTASGTQTDPTDLSFGYTSTPSPNTQYVYPTDSRKPQIYTFYIHITLEGGYEFYSAAKQLTVLSCEATLDSVGSTTLTVTPQSAPTTPQETFIGPLNAIFQFQPFVSSDVNCPMYDYDYSSSSPLFSPQSALIDFIAPDPLTLPMTATTIDVLPVDSMIDQEIIFYIRGSNYYSAYTAADSLGDVGWSNELRFRIGCGYWIGVNQPVSPHAYETTNLNQGGTIGPTVLFQFDEGVLGQFHPIEKFSTSRDYCPIERYEIIDGGAATTFGGKLTIDSSVDSSGASCGLSPIYADPTNPLPSEAASYVTCDKINVDASQTGVWNFYIKAIAKGGQELQTVNKLTFEVWCNKDKSITAPASLVDPATIHVNTQNRLYTFTFDSFLCTQSPCVDCVVDGYKIMSDQDQTQPHPLITSSVTQAGAQWSFQIDIFYPRTYKFYIQGYSSDTCSITGQCVCGSAGSACTTAGGLFIGYSNLITVVVGCGSEILTASGQLQQYNLVRGTSTQTLYLGEKIFPTFSNSITYDVPNLALSDPLFPNNGNCASVSNPCLCNQGHVYFGTGSDLKSILSAPPYYTKEISQSIMCQKDITDANSFRNDDGVTPAYTDCSCFETCGIVKYELFEDSQFSIPWSNSQVQPLNIDNLNAARVSVSNSNPAVYNIFVRAETAGGQFSSPPQPLRIVVCGQEQVQTLIKDQILELALKDYDQPFEVPEEQKTSQSFSYYFVTASTYSKWFKLNSADSNFDFCTINRYLVAKDATCSLGSLYLKDESVQLQTTTLTLGNWQNEYLGKSMVINTEIPMPDQKFYLCAYTMGNQFNYIEFEYALCGSESVYLTDLDYKIDYHQLTGSRKNVILSSDFKPYFKSTSKICNITSYKLLNAKDLKPYTENKVQFKEPEGHIIIETRQQLILNLTIQASTKFGKRHAEIPLNIYVEEIIIDPQIVNLPPIFDKPIAKVNVISIPKNTSELHTRSLKLPTFSDALNETIYVEVSSKDLDKQNYYYDEKANQIVLKDIGLEQVGNKEFVIRLVDGSGNLRDYPILINIIEEFNLFDMNEIENKTSAFWNQTTDDEKERRKQLCTAKIDEISQFGEVDILFNTNMITEGFNQSWINSTTVDIYVVPAKERHKNSGFQMSTINITSWNVTYYRNSEMRILINFTSPIDISPLIDQDLLTVHFKNVTELGFYMSKELGTPLNTTTLSYKLRKQMPNNQFNRDFKDSSELTDTALKLALVFTFILNMIISGGSMRVFVGMINSLQLIIHLPMISIIVPANVSTFFQSMVPIVCFDVLSDFGIYESVVEFDNDQQDENLQFLLDQMEDIDYDTHNAMLLLGTIGIALFYWIFKAIFCLILKALSIFMVDRKNMKKMYKKYSKSVFFNEFLAITLEGYISFVVSGYLNLKMPLYTTSGEIISNFIAFASFIISVVVMPPLLIWMILQPVQRYKTKSFKKRWGALYEGVNINYGSVKVNASYNLQFVFRRLIFLFTAFWLGEHPSLQFLTVIYLCQSTFIYIGNNMPLISRMNNRIELVNESFVLLVSTHMMFFTEWMPDKEREYEMGWSMIAFIVIFMLINLSILLYSIAHSIGLIIKKYWIRLKEKLRKLKNHFWPPPHQAIVKRQNAFYVKPPNGMQVNANVTKKRSEAIQQDNRTSEQVKSDLRIKRNKNIIKRNHLKGTRINPFKKKNKYQLDLSKIKEEDQEQNKSTSSDKRVIQTLPAHPNQEWLNTKAEDFDFDKIHAERIRLHNLMAPKANKKELSLNEAPQIPVNPMQFYGAIKNQRITARSRHFDFDA